jgi:ribonuclease H / adenosylcobalamin/alpha-ribazole phosphatase
MLMLNHSDDAPVNRFYLVRHGAHDEFGQLLSGRAGQSRLSEAGLLQARKLADWASRANASTVQASPRKRTQETAAIIAQAQGLPVETVNALDEVDFGAWNGRDFAELEEDPLWHEWNSRRASAITPGGEQMADAVTRVTAHLERAGEVPGIAPAMIVTHCDIIRGVIAQYLGLSLENMLRFDIDPGSVSTVDIGHGHARIIRINEVPA